MGEHDAKRDAGSCTWNSLSRYRNPIWHGKARNPKRTNHPSHIWTGLASKLASPPAWSFASHGTRFGTSPGIRFAIPHNVKGLAPLIGSALSTVG
jgi:hypothetical protein